ncbi:hypothetical protein ACVRZD_08970 [Streptococcus hongkongensis]
MQVFISMENEDPIVPLAESQHVVKLFGDRNADVTTYWVKSHQIT